MNKAKGWGIWVGWEIFSTFDIFLLLNAWVFIWLELFIAVLMNIEKYVPVRIMKWASNEEGEM